MSPVRTAGPTGPRTEEGKARSSLNSLKNGLFSAHDFIREGEHAEYATIQTSLLNQLTPEGTLEQTFATEILGATWRLRRCRLVETEFSSRTEVDPILTAADETVSKDQKSVDRARSQAHGILRRSMAELRRLQNERCLRQQLPFPNVTGLADARQISATVKSIEKQNVEDRVNKGLAAVQAVMDRTRRLPVSITPRSTSATAEAQTANPEPDSSFCKTAETPAKPQKTTPRNAQCPCNSGKKYKRCCGKDAPIAQGIAA